MPAPKQFKISTRSLSRHLAGKLQERVAQLKEDPSLLLAECRHKGGCPRGRIERRLRRVQRAAGNRSRLRRMARRGPHLVRAYAGALDLAFADSLGAYAAVPNPFGGAQIKYAPRGNAKREVQAAVQNFNDKGIRLLTMVEYARGFRGVYLFSIEDGLLCTGHAADPPLEYLEECAARSSPPLARSGDDFVCSHLKAMRAGFPRAEDETHLAAKWTASTCAMRVCRSCAREGNLVQSLTKYAIGPKVADQIEVWFELRPRCKEAASERCHFDTRLDLEEEELKRYKAGKLTDGEILEKARNKALADLDLREDGYFLVSGDCLGNDSKALIEALKPEEEVGRALEAAFEGSRRNLVVDSMTASKVLAKFWDTKAREILEAACGDVEVARRVVKEAKPSEAPVTLVMKAARLARHAAVEEELPGLEETSFEVAFADRVARAYRRGGEEAAVRELEQGRGHSPAAGSISWSFLLALNRAGGRDWQFSKVEIERGAHAKAAAARLLRCRGEDYAAALKALLESAGVQADIELKTT